MKYLYEKCFYNNNLKKYMLELVDSDGFTVRETETTSGQLTYGFPLERELLGSTYVLVRTEQYMNSDNEWKAVWEEKESYEESVTLGKE